MASRLLAGSRHKRAPSALTASYATAVATGTRMNIVGRLAVRLFANEARAAARLEEACYEPEAPFVDTCGHCWNTCGSLVWQTGHEPLPASLARVACLAPGLLRACNGTVTLLYWAKTPAEGLAAALERGSSGGRA